MSSSRLWFAVRIDVLRREYCANCHIAKRSPRSTGVRLFLERVKSPSGLRVMDFGCSNWRNSAYLESLGAYVVRVDAVVYTRPNVVAYPTHLPFRGRAFDVVLFTHIFMFLEDKAHWPAAAAELRRVSRRYIVVETYAVKNPVALRYRPEEVEALFGRAARRIVRPDLQVYLFDFAM